MEFARREYSFAFRYYYSYSENLQNVYFDAEQTYRGVSKRNIDFKFSIPESIDIENKNNLGYFDFSAIKVSAVVNSRFGVTRAVVVETLDNASGDVSDDIYEDISMKYLIVSGEDENLDNYTSSDNDVKIKCSGLYIQ